MTTGQFLAVLPLLACLGCQSPATESSRANETASIVVPAVAVGDDDLGDPYLEPWLRANYPDAGPIRYYSTHTDLNGDGDFEIVAYISSPTLCGTGGCNLLIFDRNGDELIQRGNVTIAQLPAGKLATRTNGWLDLAVSISGGGVEPGIARLPFDGAHYASNPTVPPATRSGTIGRSLFEGYTWTELD